jgi:hypothetical protein
LLRLGYERGAYDRVHRFGKENVVLLASCFSSEYCSRPKAPGCCTISVSEAWNMTSSLNKVLQGSCQEIASSQFTDSSPRGSTLLKFLDLVLDCTVVIFLSHATKSGRGYTEMMG